jgi:polysaccharide biosynthesis protein PslA
MTLNANASPAVGSGVDRPPLHEVSSTQTPALRSVSSGSGWSGELAVSALVALDVCAVLLAGMAADAAVGGASWRPAAHLAGSAMAALAVVQVNAVLRLYDPTVVLRPWPMIDRVLTALSIAFGSLATMVYLSGMPFVYPSAWKLGLFIFSFLSICAARLGLGHAIVRLGSQQRLSRNVAIIGSGGHAKRLVSQLERMRVPWTRVVGVFDDRARSSNVRTPKRLGGRYPVLGTTDDLIELTRHIRVDEILLALPWTAEGRISELLAKVQVIPANVHLWPDVPCSAFFTRQVTLLDGLPVVTMASKPIDGWGNIGKWALDKILATVALLLSFPLLSLVALLIKLESHGPIFFRQPRLGFNNQIFHVYKFRTMLHAARDSGAERLVTRNDPRVTRIGRVLRATSIDELPQILNVLLGDMSLVGPRPHALKAKAGGQPYHEVVAEYALRHRMKPGITGWAQINGWRGETDTEEKLVRRVEHDLYYMNNWSILFDLYILAMTVLKVPFQKSAY